MPKDAFGVMDCPRHLMPEIGMGYFRKRTAVPGFVQKSGFVQKLTYPQQDTIMLRETKWFRVTVRRVKAGRRAKQ